MNYWFHSRVWCIFLVHGFGLFLKINFSDRPTRLNNGRIEKNNVFTRKFISKITSNKLNKHKKQESFWLMVVHLNISLFFKMKETLYIKKYFHWEQGNLQQTYMIPTKTKRIWRGISRISFFKKDSVTEHKNSWYIKFITCFS